MVDEEQLDAVKKDIEGMQQYRVCQQEILRLEKELVRLNDEGEEARMASRKEEQDVVDLEHSGVHKVFLKVTGKYNTVKSKEEQEAKEAQIAFGRNVLKVEELEKQLEDWKKRQLPFMDCAKRIREAYEAPNNKVEFTTEMKAALITEYEYDKTEITEDMDVIRKVVNLAYGISDELKKIEGGLQKADAMGYVDMYGGTLRAGMPKQQQLTEAESRWDVLQKLLHKLQKESQKVNRELSISEGVKIEGGAMFADIFLDSLFTDLKMQKQIQTSKVNIHKLKQKIDSMIKQLIKQMDWEKLKVREYEKQIKELKEGLES